MRIAYLCYWNAFSPDGVSTKIRTQAEAWRATGDEVLVFCVSPRGPAGIAPVLGDEVFEFHGLASRAHATVRALRAIAHSRPDVVYIREDVFLPPPTPLLSRFPTVVEVNGGAEFATSHEPASGNRLRQLSALVDGLYPRLCRWVTLRRADGIVTPGHAVADAVAGFDRPTLVVPNSVRLADSIERPDPAVRPSFVMLVGATTPWQGLDKLPPLIEAMPDWDFRIVGVEPHDVPWRHRPGNVELHPLLPYHRYRPLVASADIGIGTLALHRKDMDEISPLKVREYLAHGLPVLIGYADTAFLDDAPWFLHRLPNIESNVVDNIDAIRRFAESVRGRRVAHAEVADAIGAEAVERRRRDFLARVAAEPVSGDAG
jgi:hypothetical protein